MADEQRTDLSPVTVIGLGPMGQALAGAFLKAGHPTTVWNRTASKADALEAQGAHRAETVAHAVKAGPLVIACVLDYDTVHAILDPVTNVLKGRTLVNLTADSPDRARTMAAWAAEHDIDYLDGSIMTPIETIGGPAAAVFYSGPDEVYEDHRSTLASLGGRATHLGTDPGRAAAYDVALLDIFWMSMSGIAHAFALADAEGIAATDLAPYAQAGVGILPGIIANLAQQIHDGDYSGDRSSVISAAAGMDHIIHTAQVRGIDTAAISAAKAIAQRAIDAGHGADGFARLAEMLRNPMR